MKNIMVIGGCGYLGSELVRHLLENTDYYIIIFDKLYFGNDSIKDTFRNGRTEFYNCDIRNIIAIKECFMSFNIDAVIHLAAISNDPSAELNISTTMGINIGTQNILDLCVSQEIKKFIFASTCSVYGYGDGILNETSKTNPLSIYGKSKLLAEELIKIYANKIEDISILRFGTMFGYSKRFRTDLVVNTMIKDALIKGEIVVDGGEQYRPLIHVKDLANAITMLLGNNKKRCEIYNLVNFNMTISDLSDNIADIYNREYNQKVVVKKNADNPADKRDYNVSNKKFVDEFTYRFKYGLDNAVKEIAGAYYNGKLRDLENPIYNNTAWILHLLYMEGYIKNIKGEIL